MAGSDEFLFLIGRFDRSLGRLEKGLSVAPKKGREIVIARGYLRHSRRWLDEVIRADPKSLKSEGISLLPLHRAVTHVEAFTPQKMKFDRLGRTIDAALQHTYGVLSPHASGLGMTLRKPVTYAKTLSVLPGDPDFPSEDEGGTSPQAKVKVRTTKKPTSFLSGNSDFDSE